MDLVPADNKKPATTAGLIYQLSCDARPLESFIKTLQCFLERSKGGINFGDLPLELIRVEQDDSAASACELRVTLYPSDAFLRFSGAISARD